MHPLNARGNGMVRQAVYQPQRGLIVALLFDPFGVGAPGFELLEHLAEHDQLHPLAIAGLAL